MDFSPSSSDDCKVWTILSRAYRRLHIIKCSARFPDPALTLSELLGGLGWNFLCITQETIYINSSRRFLKFRPWAEIWGPLGAPPGAKNDEKFFSDFSFFLVGTDQVMSVLLKNIIFSSILVLSRDLQWFLMHSSNLISLVDSRRFAFLCFQPHASNWGWDRKRKLWQSICVSGQFLDCN